MPRVRLVFGTLLALAGMLASLPSPTYAAASSEGLSISPVRDQLAEDAGSSSTHSIIVANLTKQTLSVSLAIKEFSVIDSNYDYAFKAPQYDWITLPSNAISLSAGQSRTVSYQFTPSAEATPGGYYYTIVASSTLQSGGISTTLQAASLLYVTINGELDKGTSLDNSSISPVIFGSQAPYTIDTSDSGNVYYFIYVNASLKNFYDSSTVPTAAHIVMPDQQRHITGSIDMPFWPGVYTAHLGYRTDSGNILNNDHVVVYLPPWSLLFSVGLVYLIVHLLRRRRKRLAALPAKPDERPRLSIDRKKK